MRKGLIIGANLLLTPSGLFADDHQFYAPSGLVFDPPEVIFEPVGVLATQAKRLRLRFVAPQISDTEKFGFEKLEADFEYLCTVSGLKIAKRSAPKLEQIIVSISSDPIALGETVPSVAQYFDAFSVVDGTCIWDGI